jgi:prepilin-type N-terminal cleavage/methylation domain-containing protein
MRLRFLGQKGFTLIELLTAISVFSVLLLIIVGIFTRFVFVQRRDIGEQRIQEDLRFALELMNREIRTGYGTTYESAGKILYFRNQNRVCVAYRFQQVGAVGSERLELQRAENTAVPLTDRCAQNYTNYKALVSQETRFERAAFSVHAAQEADGKLTSQGFVTLRIRAYAAQKPDQVVTIQNTVTSRQVKPFRAPS